MRGKYSNDLKDMGCGLHSPTSGQDLVMGSSEHGKQLQVL